MSAPAKAAALLRLGLAAGPFYVAVGLGQVLAREGFDPRRHALSHLSRGELGWIQVTSFVVTGLLVLAGALGVRRLLRGRRGGTWGPLLLAVYAIGLIGAGVFRADPAPDFPPGTGPVADELSRDGLLHFAFGGLGFYALIAACLVFARRFARTGRRAWAWLSGLTGAAFFAAFAGVASGSTAPAVMLAFYAAVAWTWCWHAALHATLLREAPASAALARTDGGTSR